MKINVVRNLYFQQHTMSTTATGYTGNGTRPTQEDIQILFGLIDQTDTLEAALRQFAKLEGTVQDLQIMIKNYVGSFDAQQTDRAIKQLQSMTVTVPSDITRTILQYDPRPYLSQKKYDPRYGVEDKKNFLCHTERSPELAFWFEPNICEVFTMIFSFVQIEWTSAIHE